MGIPTTKVSFKAPTFRRLRIKIALKSKFSNCYPADKKAISDYIREKGTLRGFENDSIKFAKPL